MIRGRPRSTRTDALVRYRTLCRAHGVAVVVAEDLHLDMARRRQAALQQDMLVAERGLGLAARRLPRFEEIVLARHHSHALAAAAGGRLDNQRVADLLRLRRQGLGSLPAAVVAAPQGNAAPPRP